MGKELLDEMKSEEEKKDTKSMRGASLVEGPLNISPAPLSPLVQVCFAARLV